MQSAGSKPPSEREPLAGLVERVTFHNADNGFCILCIKARGHRELVTVLGAAPSIAAGEYIQASGTWENNREHGLQFRAAFLHTAAPASAEGMERIPGLGPHQRDRPGLRPAPGDAGGTTKGLDHCGQGFPRRAPMVKTAAVAAHRGRGRNPRLRDLRLRPLQFSQPQIAFRL